jgi:hypothetical protein
MTSRQKAQARRCQRRAQSAAQAAHYWRDSFPKTSGQVSLFKAWSNAAALEARRARQIMGLEV